MNENSQEPQPTHIECSPTKDPAVRWFIFAAMMLGFGLYTIWDHYVKGNYPRPDPYSFNDYLSYLFNHYIPYVLIPLGLLAVGTFLLLPDHFFLAMAFLSGGLLIGSGLWFMRHQG